MTPAVPPPVALASASGWPVLQAPPQWRTLDFISDLHLQASEPATFEAWQHYLQTTQADAVFILGDLFEVWVGDDIATDGLNLSRDPSSSFEVRCAQVLAAASQRLRLFFMHGNRDFLLGPKFADACGMALLNDPCVLDFAGQRWLLSHGDALCLDDTDYMLFRAQVRSAAWQQEFLEKPLAQRQDIAHSLRAQSESRKSSGASYADVDSPTACDWLNAAQASTLIHGHTHQPGEHDMAPAQANTLRRIVLSDWDANATPPRLEVVRLTSNPEAACKVQRLPTHLTA